MRSPCIIVLALVPVLAPPAHADKRAVEVHPYLEVDASVLGDLKHGGNTTAYVSAASGVDATITTARTKGQIAYRYEHRFSVKGNGSDDVHSGLARIGTELVPNLLHFDAGALATRTRTDIRGQADNPLVSNARNISQLYSVYLGPQIGTRVGDFDVSAAYRFGYTKVDTKTRGTFAGGTVTPGTFDSSTSHVATASLGMRSGVLVPFGWTVSAGYEREDAGQLDQRFESKNVRLDIVQPVSPTLAITGGVGYEKIQSSQRNPLIDVNGNPVVNADGRYAVDPASPRVLSYDQAGIIYDTGVIWKPSRRTSLTAHVGWRYGSTNFGGDFGYQPDANNSFAVDVYDGIQTFGRQLNASVAALPEQFALSANPFGNQTSGCVYGSGTGGAGACLNPALQSLTAGTYRAQGISAVWRHTRGPWHTGVGVGYAQRRFYASGVLASLNGLTDRSYYAQGYVGTRLDERSGIDASAYVDLLDPGAVGSPNVLGTGATGSYYRNFTDRLTATAALGLYSTRIEGIDSTLNGQALVGARYTF